MKGNKRSLLRGPAAPYDEEAAFRRCQGPDPNAALSARWVVEEIDGHLQCLWIAVRDAADQASWPFAADWPIEPSVACDDHDQDLVPMPRQRGARRRLEPSWITNVSLLVATAAALGMGILAVDAAAPTVQVKQISLEEF